MKRHQSKSDLVSEHLPCPCGESSDAYATYSDGHGFCFSGSCKKPYFKGSKLELSDVVDESEYTYEFLPWRGVSREVMQFYNVVTKVNKDGKPTALAAPFDNGAKQIRSYDKKDFRWSGEGSKASLFGVDRFQAGGKSVVITEGWLDSLSLYEVLRTACVSVRSSSSARKDCSQFHDYLNSFEKIYLCLDNDEAGKKAATEIAKLFEFDKVYNIPLKYKDANDYLTNNDRTELHKAFQGAKRLVPEDVASGREEFHSIINGGERKTGTPYPFPTLQQATGGIRTGQCVLLSGDEGIGKTEFIRAIEYHLLTTTDARIATIHMEEDKREQLARLAGYHLNCPAHLEETGTSNEEINSALDEILGTNEPDSRLHLYSHFDTDEPDIILDRIRFLVSVCGAKYVFLDHIGKLVSGRTDEDERKRLDYLATKLDQMARDLDFSIFIVAHENAQGRIRGSTYPSKIAHLWLRISRNLVAETEEERNKTYIEIAKNRYRAKTGPGGVLSFDPETFKISEIIVGDLPV